MNCGNAHFDFIKKEYTVLAEAEGAIFFEACGEKIAEVNGGVWNCETKEDFFDLVEQFGDETFEE